MVGYIFVALTTLASEVLTDAVGANPPRCIYCVGAARVMCCAALRAASDLELSRAYDSARPMM